MTARMCGAKVRVDGDESETTEVYALPDGSLQASTAMAPQRVRQADGSWKPVDLAFVANKDGSVSPASSAFGVTVAASTSDGGEHHLVSVGTGAGAVSLDWTGPIPTPTLSGGTATYVDVRPGVDLVVEMTASGVEQNIVVKTPAALDEIKNLTLPLVAKAEHTFTAKHNAITLKDKTGHAFVQIPGMSMWDSSPVDPDTGGPVKHDLAAKVAELPAKKGRAPGVGLALTPDDKWLSDPSRVFPITLDPTLNPESTTWDTYVRDDLTSDHSGDSDLQLGVTSGHVARAFLSWDMTAMEHAVISSATINFFDFYSASCTPASWEVWSTTSSNTDPYTQWSNQPPKIKQESTSTGTKGFSTSCDDGWVSVDGKNFFTDAAATGKNRGYMELVATDESSTSIGFKQFRSRQATDPSQVPYAVVTYTSTPVIGTRSTTPTTSCVTGSNRPYVSSKTPKLSTVVTQGDGATSNVNFEWWNVGGAKIGGATVTGVVSGNAASTTAPAGAFAEAGSYMWRVAASSGVATSAWSSYCEFTVDSIAPSAAPTVSSTTYPAGQWAGAAGTAGVFTLGANGVSDVNSYLYGLDTPTPTTPITASALGGTAAPSITPATNGNHVLYVQSVDRAGNKSGITQYAFSVGAAAITSPTEGAQTAGTTVLSGQAPSTTTGVTYQWKRADTDTWTNIPTSDVTKQAGGAVTSWPVTPTGGVYPNLNWNVKQTLANANTPANLTSRWMLADAAGSTAADMTGAHPATLNGGVTWSQDPNHGMTAAFNGSTGYFATSTAVLSTNNSYTVSAWVKLTGTSTDQTVISQNGTTRSPFYLQLDGGSVDKWQLNIDSADVSSPTWYTARDSATAPAGVWTHVVGVYDSAAHTGKLYVNGVLKATVSGVTTWASTGVTWIGRSASTWVGGNLSDVQTYARALSATEVTNLYGTGSVTGDAVALAGPVQVQAIFAGTGGHTTDPTQFSFDPNNASAASSQVGPGSVNLLTGNMTLSGSDVSVSSYGSDLTAARTFNTRQPGVFDDTHMFGPGWTSTATVADTGALYTGLTVVGSLVQVGTIDGTTIGFTAETASTFTPEVGEEDLTLALSGSTYTLTDEDGNRVDFTHLSNTPVGEYAPTAITEAGSGDTTSMTYATPTVDGVTVTRPTQLLAPVPTGVTCNSPLTTKGCRTLTFTYATATTATGATQADWGDYIGRVQKISFTAWDPNANPASMTTVDLSSYLYDSNGRLVAQWNPRLDNGSTHLWTTYSYNGDGTIATITPNTQPAWSLAYTTVPGDSGIGRVASVSRSALTAGTATTTVVYRVPTTGSGAPYDMSVGQTARWDEQAAPVAAAAVFDAGQVPDGNQASGAMPSSWTRATVTYMDANSSSVNTVTPGGNIITTWYDQYGNTTRTLTASNRLKALAVTGDTAAAAAARSTLNIYSDPTSTIGQQLITSLGPQHDVTLSTGQVVQGRDLTQNTYDVGAPANTCPCGLVTTEVTGTRWWDSGGVQQDADLRTTTTSYDWTLRQPVASDTDPGASPHLDLSARTEYDPETGLVVAMTRAAGGASDATPATTQLIYYRAGAGSGYPECDSHPEWANLVCRTQPGGQPSSGPELPVTVTTYDTYNQPVVVTEENSAGTLRTTTTSYDGAGRESTVAVVGTPGIGIPVPNQRNIYDSATGELTNVQSLDAGNTVTAQTITGYDALGRVTTYTDSDGNQSTTSYDLMSRPTTTSDGAQSATTSYDTGSERRGLATQVVDGQAGTITGSYDADGNLVTENWPNGIIVSHTYDEDNNQTGISYVHPGCGQADCTLYTQTASVNAAGDVAGYTSTLSMQNYGYDNAGRLTNIQDLQSGQCTTRIYGFGSSAAGKASDRTSLTSYDPAADGTCQNTTSASSSTWTYDTADRTINAGYVYDAMGRATTVPAADTQLADGSDLTVTYNVNDLVHSIQQGANAAAVYTLDVDNQRIRSWTDTQGVTHTNHYSGISDSPSWTNGSDGTSSRDIDGLSALVAIATGTGNTIEWQMCDLHGDIVATTPDGGSVDSVSEADEYGNMRDSAQVGTKRYGWLGSKERAADNPDGIVLMGMRLYNPTAGRFLQVDPIDNGSCSAYDYVCADPVNAEDVAGTTRDAPGGSAPPKYWPHTGRGMLKLCHDGAWWYRETHPACQAAWAAGWRAGRALLRYFHEGMGGARNRSGRADAFLHVMWAAIAYLYGGSRAFHLVLAHENDTDHNHRESFYDGLMDTVNDWTGYDLARRFDSGWCSLSQECVIHKIERAAYRMAMRGELYTIDSGN